MGDSTAMESQITARVQEFLDEALTGPEKGGIAGQVQVGDVTVEAWASRGWGVEFSRSLPGGDVARQRITGAELTVTHAGAALGRLLRAA